MTQQMQIGPGVAPAQGYGALTGSHLDTYLRAIKVYTQQNVYFESNLDRVAMSPVVRNDTGPGKGSTLRFMRTNSIGVHPMNNNGKFNLQEISVDWDEIKLGDMWGWMFKVSQKDMMWEPQFINQLLTEQLRGVARSMQTRLMQKIYLRQIAEASYLNQGPNAGMRDKCTHLGTKSQPLELTPDNVHFFFLDLHYVAYQMGLAENQIFISAPPWLRTLISRAGFLCDASKSGLGRSSLLMDPDEVRRQMTAADVMFDHCLPFCRPGEAGNTTDKIVYPIIFGSPMATGYAVYADDMQIIDKTKGEASVYFQGQLCSGDAVLEPCMLGVSWVSIDKRLLSAFHFENKPSTLPPAPVPPSPIGGFAGAPEVVAAP